MQKITALVPAIIAGWIVAGAFKNQGLLFMEDLGKDPKFPLSLIATLRAKGIQINRFKRWPEK